MLCLNVRQLGKVLNRLNARQSEILTEFPLKDSLKLVFDVSLEMESDYVDVQDDEITEPVHTIESECA